MDHPKILIILFFKNKSIVKNFEAELSWKCSFSLKENNLLLGVFWYKQNLYGPSTNIFTPVSLKSKLVLDFETILKEYFHKINFFVIKSVLAFISKRLFFEKMQKFKYFMHEQCIKYSRIAWIFFKPNTIHS